jgi:TolB protein
MRPTALRPALLAACVAALPPAARADRPVIDLSGARVQAYPIALAPLQGPADAAGPILQVVQADLERSGLFRVLDPKSFVADVAKEGLTPTTIDFSRWTTVGAQGLVKGTVTAEGDTLKAELRLFDAPRATQLLTGTYSAPRGGLRQIAHRFADDLLRYFTQEPGIFQTRIAYVREGENGKNIVVADSDGFDPRPLTTASINLLPAWAPDGRSVAFTSFRDGSPHIYSVDVATRAIKSLVLMGDFATGAAYAPDGLRFTFSASVNDNTDVYISQADGSAGRKLTDARGIDISATWSPDGKQLAFVSERSGVPHLYVMNADGSGVRRLTFQGNYNQEPAWSPRGDLIAFSCRDERRMFDVFTVHVHTGKVTRLTQGAGNNESPVWAPNGRYLLFVSSRTGRRQIWMMGADGSNPRQVTSEPRGASGPAWGPLPAK